MQLTPRYGDEAVLVIDGAADAVGTPAIRQSHRLLDIVRGFDAGHWARPSRCAGWSNRDVISHLDTANQFWSMAIDAGRRGEPTRFLASFDPVTSPAQLVAATQTREDGEVLDRFEASTSALTDLVGALDGEAWNAPAEAPLGHISTSAVVHHALWDSWIHERDILVPLGASQALEEDEITACLRYVAALGPAFAANDGSTAEGTLVVATTDPEVSFEVDIGRRVQVRSVHPGAARSDTSSPALRLTGSCIDLLEALSIRAPLPAVPPDQAWMVSGLASTFDADPSARIR